MELSQALGIINLTAPDEVQSLADLLSPDLIQQAFSLTDTVTTYRYDGLGRRISKSTTIAPDPFTPNARLDEPKVTRFVWEGLRLLQEIPEYGLHKEKLYLYSDSGSYEPLARLDDNHQLYWYHTTPNGTPERLTDEAGEVRWQGVNNAWGKQIYQPMVTGGRVEQNLRMQGQYYDEESGLHYNLFRYYDPDSGRFTQLDPIGLAGGLNLYQYAPNALGWVDPLGLSCSPMVKKINGRNPSNSSFAGKVYPASKLPVDIRGKYPHGVPFNHAGFPDFSRYSIRNTRIELGSSRNVDFARADRAVGYGLGNPRPEGYTWHHHQDSGYMQLVPTDIHDAVRHSGGISTNRR